MENSVARRKQFWLSLYYNVVSSKCTTKEYQNFITSSYENLSLQPQEYEFLIGGWFCYTTLAVLKINIVAKYMVGDWGLDAIFSVTEASFS